jgi:hypothetical protein
LGIGAISRSDDTDANSNDEQESHVRLLVG